MSTLCLCVRPWSYGSFQSGWGKMQRFQPRVSVGHCSLIFSDHFPLGSRVSSHELINQYSLSIREGPSAAPWGILSIQLLLFVAWSCQLHPTWPPDSQLHLLHPDLPSLHQSLETVPRQQAGAIIRLISLVSCLSGIIIFCCQLS